MMECKLPTCEKKFENKIYNKLFCCYRHATLYKRIQYKIRDSIYHNPLKHDDEYNENYRLMKK